MVDQPPPFQFPGFVLNHDSSSPFHYNQLHPPPPLSIPHSPPTSLLPTPLIPFIHHHYQQQVKPPTSNIQLEN